MTDVNANTMSPEWLEGLNGFIFIQSVQLVLIFGYFLWRYREDFGQEYFNLITAIWTYHFGITLVFFWRWLWRWFGNNGYAAQAEWMTLWPVPLVGTIIMGVGLLCKIRVVTYSGWGSLPWVLSLLTSIIFVFITTAIL